MAANCRRTNIVVSRLMALGCPYLQIMEENVAGKVVLTPGEARARVLSWLLNRFQREQNGAQTCLSMNTGSLIDQFASIGLCKKENLALIEGRTSLSQQLLFLESLLDMVEAVVSVEGMAQVECSCRFIDSICSSERLDSSVFTCSINLLPTDVAHCVEGRTVTTEQLGTERQKLTAVLQERQTELHSILQQHHFEELNTAAMKSHVKVLTVSLSTLTQLLTSFCQSYEAELQPWVGHRQPPQLGQLGPLCRKTATQWNHISKILVSLQEMEATLKRLQSMPVGMHLTDMYKVCCKAHEALQQWQVGQDCNN